MKKSLEYYLSLPYTLEIIPDTEEGGYGARYPELVGCITCGETLIECVKNAEDAKKAWLETALKNKMDIPVPKKEEEYSGQFKLRIPRSLHRSLAIKSKQEGISMNQYCLYLLTRNNAEYVMASKSDDKMLQIS